MKNIPLDQKTKNDIGGNVTSIGVNDTQNKSTTLETYYWKSC
jgi:hypothetical protein